jgi:hypothetical protein
MANFLQKNSRFFDSETIWWNDLIFRYVMLLTQSYYKKIIASRQNTKWRLKSRWRWFFFIFHQIFSYSDKKCFRHHLSLTLSLDFDLPKWICLNGLFWFSFDKVRHFLSKFSTLVKSQKNGFFCTFWCIQMWFQKIVFYKFF